MNESISPKQRMEQVIDYAYILFCNQVAGEAIIVENEASMQLHLSNILLQLGRLNVFSQDEYFNVILEKKFEDMNTSKSKKNARVDIWLELKKADKVICEAAIELKYLKKADPAVTDARYHVYQDLENLEQYKSRHNNLITCEIIYTDNPNFQVNKGEKFSIAEDVIVSSYDGDQTQSYEQITLNDDYAPIKWDKIGNHNFLKIFPVN